jgi:hypothetical protein
LIYLINRLNLGTNLLSMNTIEACERYRRNAFRVQQQDNCRLIQYDTTDSANFYGSIFTNATLDAQPLRVILEKIIGV